MHRETPLDFWLTVAVVISLFVPIWGVLLAPTRLISVPSYLLFIGSTAFLVIMGVLIYGKLKNRVLLNRFLIGYIGGLIGTAALHVFLIAGSILELTPSLVYSLGNLVLGRGLQETHSENALIIGIGYHYLLNGAAWGAAYALLAGKAKWWYGLFFGLAVWAVFMASPVFYALELPRNAIRYGPLVITLMLIAHLFYGGAVGYIVYRFVFPEVGIEGAKAVRPTYG